LECGKKNGNNAVFGFFRAYLVVLYFLYYRLYIRFISCGSGVFLLVRRGRPKSVSIRKNRTHSVVLDEESQWILNCIRKDVRRHFDFSHYVSECLKRDFDYDFVGYSKYRVGKINEMIKDLQDQQTRIFEDVRVWRELKAKKKSGFFVRRWCEIDD